MDFSIGSDLFGYHVLWTILWTDILIFFLVGAITLFLISLRKNPENRQRWRQVFSTRLGMSTFVIIMAYIAIALVDSIHFRKALPAVEGQGSEQIFYSNTVNSLLDLALGEMGEQHERTYSAPFALKSWNKENLLLPGGERVRDYPVLKYGGQHLKNDEDKQRDIALNSLLGLGKGLALALLLISLHARWLKKRSKSSEPDLPWRAGWITFAIIMALLGWLITLGNLYHVLGTDQAGNDTLYESLKGIRTGVLIGTLATLITMPIAISLGIAAGYFKGWIDDVVQYIYTTLISIPGLLLIAASVLLFQVWINNNPDFFEVGLEKADAKFLALCFILGITSWTSLCRLLRAETLKISQLDYVQAAHAFGVSHFQIIRRHILPNLSHIIIISFVLDFSALVLAEAVLSYIGVGVDPAMASWGNMINMASTELSREPSIWWNLSGAFFLMFVLVLSVNLFSDLVNDAFDPKTQLEAA
ncbi:ABC transporter permease [Endozoicomonas elysicola]|uniref:Peptide ABC transporter permease n=1 Tax=Endozoicomonas elysicola TaxID=305900 RepID=A0A081KBC1_9GAMM|nr:ABC transporter permease [Endozoicomonas elysicola]KEI71447.1 peptide ABC transporter permease [Endozoicomonas elysicola]